MFVHALHLFLAAVPPVAAQSTCADVAGAPLVCGGGPVSGAVAPDVDPQAPATLDGPYTACGLGAYPGHQDVRAFACTSDIDVTLDLDGLACDLDLVVLDNDCGGSDCVVASASAGAASESVTWSCARGHVYFLVVERGDCSAGAASACSCSDADFPYDLSLTCHETCDNRLDDDNDGLIDCLDPDCPACVEDCTNHVDDDFDGDTDCEDDDCCCDSGCAETATPNATDSSAAAAGVDTSPPDTQRADETGDTAPNTGSGVPSHPARRATGCSSGGCAGGCSTGAPAGGAGVAPMIALWILRRRRRRIRPHGGSSAAARASASRHPATPPAARR